MTESEYLDWRAQPGMFSNNRQIDAYYNDMQGDPFEPGDAARGYRIVYEAPQEDGSTVLVSPFVGIPKNAVGTRMYAQGSFLSREGNYAELVKPTGELVRKNTARHHPLTVHHSINDEGFYYWASKEIAEDFLKHVIADSIMLETSPQHEYVAHEGAKVLGTRATDGMGRYTKERLGNLAIYKVTGTAIPNSRNDGGSVMEDMMYSPEPILRIPVTLPYEALHSQAVDTNADDFFP